MTPHSRLQNYTKFSALASHPRVSATSYAGSTPVDGQAQFVRLGKCPSVPIARALTKFFPRFWGTYRFCFTHA